jgi:uncharacterized membrane protein (Fun14 family)
MLIAIVLKVYKIAAFLIGGSLISLKMLEATEIIEVKYDVIQKDLLV